MPIPEHGSLLTRLLERLRSLGRKVTSSSAISPGNAAGEGGSVRPRAYYAPGGLKLIDDPSWNDAAGALDPALRLAISLIEKQDRIQLLERTGIDAGPGAQGAQFLPLHVELNVKPDAQVHQYLAGRGLIVPQAYFDEAAENHQLRSVTARVRLGKEISGGDASILRSMLQGLGADTLKAPAIIKRISLANPLQPCFVGSSLRDLNLPVHRQHGGTTVDGRDVIVGIIDDGCAFAHRDFLRPGTFRSRVLYLWDQARDQARVGGGWVVANGFPYGCEISNVPTDPHQYLDEAIAPHVAASGLVNEDAVHESLGYKIPALASHGTHVMGIAAGNGQSAMGFEGVAPAADIIFVQLPAAAIEVGMPALSLKIADAATYIFARAKTLGKSAVINISYGGYSGPHDGTAPLETHLDYLLAKPDRAVVVSAGNGFEADCHARGRIRPSASSKVLRWILRPFDPTLNFLEIWYNQSATVDLWITTPDGQTLLPVHLGSTHQYLVLASNPGVIVGLVDHQKDARNNDNHIAIWLWPTLLDDPLVAGVAPAPSGVWSIQLENVGTQHEATFHAWIERDDAGHPSGARRRQSQFDTRDSSPDYSLAGLATGLHTIVVGGYNTATQEVCRYSACGPTRATAAIPSRAKPDVCAPAEEDVAGRGVLSASSRRGQATRMNGTSASAPHVAGTIALMFQYRDHVRGGPLGADQIRHKLKAAAHTASLKQNRHQLADQTRLLKQKDVPWGDVIGAGKIDIAGSL
jgi:subtilisin family serine protease